MTVDAVDHVAVLPKAWADWDTAAYAMGENERRSKGRYKPGALTLERVAHAKEAAIAALGIDAVELHRLVASIRRRHIAGDPDRKGMPILDAVETALLEMGVINEPPQLKEAS